MHHSETEVRARVRAAIDRLSPEQRRDALLLAIAIGALNALGFFLLFALVAPRQLALQGGGVFGVGLGLTAYGLGIRHAFDADHIAAIDGATRKLTQEGRSCLGVGFFFALGHSTVVVVLGALVGLGIAGAGGALTDEGSTLNLIAGTWGPLVAGVFLLFVGALNLAALGAIARALARARSGHAAVDELETHLAPRGPLGRVYNRATRSITASWQMYPVGLMFGLGFDTASEIALLVLAGGAAASGLPFYAVICLPILFAAGMALFDTLNSVLINGAYGWAFERPARRLFYNFTVTAVSVVSALSIGALSLLGVTRERFALSGGAWNWIAAIDLQYAGFVIVALFALIWAASLAAWRFGGFERG